MKSRDEKIFIVDDEPVMRRTIGDTLSELGYNVTCFASPDACLTEVEHSGCNLLISDVKMPEMNGIELLRRMKSIAPWIPVILITGYGNIPMAVRAVKIGAADFIEKPFKGSTLLNKVKEVLSRRDYDSYLNTSNLTKTEKIVLKLILDGYSNKEIAHKLGRALRTIEFHHTNIYRKFDVDNAVALTKKAMEMFPGKTIKTNQADIT